MHGFIAGISRILYEYIAIAQANTLTPHFVETSSNGREHGNTIYKDLHHCDYTVFYHSRIIAHIKD